jgi:hypothetical protein
MAHSLNANQPSHIGNFSKKGAANCALFYAIAPPIRKTTCAVIPNPAAFPGG